MITSREMEKLNEKTARVYTIYGEILEGDCVHDNEEYLECEFGLDEKGLHIADHIVLKSQIAAAEEWDVEAESGRLRAAEIRERLMFSLRKSFSEHLKRWIRSGSASPASGRPWKREAAPGLFPSGQSPRLPEPA